MKVEHRSTDSRVLPRSWWNTEDARMADLDKVRKLLDQQEFAWNGMVYYWERSANTLDVPLKSPKARQVRAEEKIQSFP